MPLTTIALPPAVEPDAGVTDVTVGGVTYVYSTPLVDATGPGFVTTTSSVPAVPATVFAVNSVSETHTTDVAAFPIVTVGVFTNPVPLIVTLVPPSVVPSAGSTFVTVGGVA